MGSFMKHATIFFVTLLAGYWSLPANAIVNIEDMRVGEPVAGYSGNVDLSIEGKTGNSDKQELSLDSRLQHYQDKVLDFVILSYDYGEASNVRNDNATLVHGRHVVQYQVENQTFSKDFHQQNPSSILRKMRIGSPLYQYLCWASKISHTWGHGVNV